jgi:hypothetical protein
MPSTEAARDLEELGDRPIEETLAALAAEVPKEEWDKLPADLTDNLDHYIYGTPKKKP